MEAEKEKKKRGAWSGEEDKKLIEYVTRHGEKRWRIVPKLGGLNRCGKSCRLRWLNYLKPGIKRGNISREEEDLIIRLHNLIGNRWALIARRLSGRTDNEIKNHWNTHLKNKSVSNQHLNSMICGGTPLRVFDTRELFSHVCPPARTLPMLHAAFRFS